MLGVKFAPLNVPLERRIQTLSVLFYTSLFVVVPIGSILLFIFVLFSKYYYLALGYGAWMYYDIAIQKTSSRGGRRIQSVRKFKLWKYLADFFPIHLIKTAELDPGKNYLMGYHPHGIIGCGAFGNFASDATGFLELFKGITPYMLTLKANFRYPILRGLLLWLGCCDVSKESIKHILTERGKGNAAVIVIGGAAEALDAKPGNYTMVLKKRRGFVRMALTTGSSLVPIFSFGENDLFYQADNPVGSRLRKFQDAFKNLLGFSPPLFYGRGVFNYTFGLIPFRKPIHTVVGAPIDVPLIKDPSQEEIDKFHQKYTDALCQLFDDHKSKYGIDEETHLLLL